MAVLDRINNVNDIKQLSISEVYMLAGEIRQFLVQHISETGGHLASNLGAVELTLALHMICDLPKDKIVWDVGHQSYTHKILTGRKEKFDTLRQFGGMSVLRVTVTALIQDTVPLLFQQDLVLRRRGIF